MATTRIRELALNLLVLAVTLGIFGVLFEVGVRLFAPQTVLTLKGLYVPDSRVGFRHRAGFVGHERNPEYDVRVFIDEHGYRVPEQPEPRSDGAYRIVGLGDSFTFGSGVEAEEVYLERIEDLLRGADPPGRPVEVVNAGAGGMGLDNEARLLEADGDILQARSRDRRLLRRQRRARRDVRLGSLRRRRRRPEAVEGGDPRPLPASAPAR